ncbi:hypothetical protein CASFOL_024713 [Castilleja foliolosa]|uniref:Solute carrier family 40 protein n=1 Tax=Castilleja foliolosa TaxID=1961234 RepID=A0ABD3CRI4_9LAMI
MNLFHYYVVFSKAILFISGLIFSYKLVDLTLFSILITHLTQWKQYTLPKAVLIVNLQEGAYAILQLLFVFLADTYTGHFMIVMCSTPSYTIGLLLCCVAARYDLISIFYAGLVIITFSKAALQVTLGAFLDDQLLRAEENAGVTTTTEENAERAYARSNFWQVLVTILAVVVAIAVSSKIRSFVTLTIILTTLMGVAFCWFLLGIKLYSRNGPTGSDLLLDIVHVIFTAAVIPKNVGSYPHENMQMIPPYVPWLRWLDKAAMVVTQDQAESKRSDNNTTCTVEQVKRVKSLLMMLPMWTTFLTYSLVSALGSTFFLEQVIYINASASTPILFNILRIFTKSVVAVTSNYILEKLQVVRHQKSSMLVRIGIGMLFCVFCCLTACINARHYTTIFRLIPQFILLGVMEGLSTNGLENLFNSQVSQSTTRYGPPFEECVQGTGKLLNIVCVLILTKWHIWIKDDISTSQLDRYYAMLAISSSLNMLIYCFVAYWYCDAEFLPDGCEVDIEMEIETSQETTSSSSENQDNPLMSSGAQSFLSRSSSGIQRRVNSLQRQ